MRAMCTQISVLGLYSFDRKDILRMAPRSRKVKEINTCYKFYFHHHHKHQGLDPLIRSDSRVTAALANVF